MSLPTRQPTASATARFEARREHILSVGSLLINERGLKGLSLEAVAEEIGIGASSVTYYYRRKDLLAEACFDRSLDALEMQVKAAAQEPDAPSRIARLVALAATSISNGGSTPLARMHEMRAMSDAPRTRLLQRYYSIFRIARGYFPQAEGAEGHLRQIMRAQILLEAVHWLPDWLRRYAPEEVERVGMRLVDLLVSGLAPPGARPAARALELPPSGHGDDKLDRFLGAATMLMNERGYRGASVERIAAASNVTKGSFYHHLAAKDELVLACFRRSLDMIGKAQDAALMSGAGHLEMLASALATLAVIQFGEGTPLLRSTALAALPPALMQEAVDRSEKVGRRFAGMVIDGIASGAVRAIDPLIAGQLILSSLNTAFELRDLSRRVAPDRAGALYVSLMLHGLVDNPGRS